MTNEELIAACVKAGETPGFVGDLLRSLAVAKRDRAFKKEALAAADYNGKMAFTHQALGMLLASEYAGMHAWPIAEVAGAAFEDANYHPEAAAVRQMGFVSSDTTVVGG
jgi:hypothetical protein